jgi:uncharacterized protein YggL (DUF469 family)
MMLSEKNYFMNEIYKYNEQKEWNRDSQEVHTLSHLVWQNLDNIRICMHSLQEREALSAFAFRVKWEFLDNTEAQSLSKKIFDIGDEELVQQNPLCVKSSTDFMDEIYKYNAQKEWNRDSREVHTLSHLIWRNLDNIRICMHSPQEREALSTFAFRMKWEFSDNTEAQSISKKVFEIGDEELVQKNGFTEKSATNAPLNVKDDYIRHLI